MSCKVSREKYRGTDWTLNESKGGNGVVSAEEAQLSVLMDIRDELKKLNALLHCSNFTSIPRRLERIARNTTKRRKVRPKLRRVG